MVTKAAPKALTLDDVRRMRAQKANTPSQSGDGGAIEVAEEGDVLLIGAHLDAPFVRSGEAKNGREAWAEVVYCTTIRSQFLKSIQFTRKDGTKLRIQVKVTEA